MIGIAILVVIIASYCWIDIRLTEPKQIDKKAIMASERDARERQRDQRPDVSEPYDDPHFYDDPDNFDLDSFWRSYSHNH